MTQRVTPRTWTVGELITKAMLDEQIRDNMNAGFPYTAAGQIALSIASNELSILAAASNANKKIVSNGTTFVLVDDTRYFTVMLNAGVSLVAGDDAARIRIPVGLNGYVISSVAASRKAGTGILTIQLRRVGGSDILSTKLTIDSGETDSSTAAIPAVINTAQDDVATAQQIAIDVDIAGTSTTYAIVQIGLTKF